MSSELEMGFYCQDHIVVLEHLALGFKAPCHFLQEFFGGRAFRIPAHQAS